MDHSGIYIHGSRDNLKTLKGWLDDLYGICVSHDRGQTQAWFGLHPIRKRINVMNV